MNWPRCSSSRPFPPRPVVPYLAVLIVWLAPRLVSTVRRSRSPVPRHETLTDVGEFVVATVKWFNPNKGFGFITVNDDSRDVFIHMQTLRRCGVTVLDRGQEVRVRIGQSSKGPQVAEIAPI